MYNPSRRRRQMDRDRAFADTDLEGMEPAAAREYVLYFIQSMKETQRQKAKKAEEATLWRTRVQQARSHNRPELAAEAESNLGGLEQEIAGLEDEEAQLRSKVEILKENLRRLEAGFRRTIDADVLLANLEMLVGETDDTEEKFKDELAQAELDELKRKMRQAEEKE
jgi:hypothetical protein